MKVSKDNETAELRFKNQSRKLCEFLESRGLALNYMGCLEAIAAINGHKTWHHLQAHCHAHPTKPLDAGAAPNATHIPSSGKKGWYSQVFIADGGFGYQLYDAQDMLLLTQAPKRNSPIPVPLTEAEAEKEGRAALLALPTPQESGSDKLAFEIYRSEHGSGYLIFNAEGRPWIEQPFAPGVPGFASMTDHGAAVLAKATISELHLRS